MPDGVLLGCCASCPVLPVLLNRKEGRRRLYLKIAGGSASLRLSSSILSVAEYAAVAVLFVCIGVGLSTFPLGRHTFLLPVGMYSYINLRMGVSFILNKSSVHFPPKLTIIYFKFYMYSFFIF